MIESWLTKDKPIDSKVQSLTRIEVIEPTDQVFCFDKGKISLEMK